MLRVTPQLDSEGNTREAFSCFIHLCVCVLTLGLLLPECGGVYHGWTLPEPAGQPLQTLPRRTFRLKVFHGGGHRYDSYPLPSTLSASLSFRKTFPWLHSSMLHSGLWLKASRAGYSRPWPGEANMVVQIKYVSRLTFYASGIFKRTVPIMNSPFCNGETEAPHLRGACVCVSPAKAVTRSQSRPSLRNEPTNPLSKTNLLPFPMTVISHFVL